MNSRQKELLESINIVPNHNPNLYLVISYPEHFPGDREDVGYDLIPIVGWKMYVGYIERNAREPEDVSFYADPIIPSVSDLFDDDYMIYDKERDVWQTHGGGGPDSGVGEESLREYLREKHGLKKKSELTVV